MKRKRDMTESQDDKTVGRSTVEPASAGQTSPTFGMVAIGCGVGYLLLLLLFGLLGLVLAVPVGFIVLAGLVSTSVGLLFHRGHSRRCTRRYVVVLVVILVLALFLLPGLGTIRTLDLHCRMRVAVTGGQDELQAWATELLATPRNEIQEFEGADETEYNEWTVPEGHWSKQVRRLNPKRLRIERTASGDREVVTLMYGGGFQHWTIGVGPPEAIGELAVKMKEADCVWFRWSDGICCWFD